MEKSIWNKIIIVLLVVLLIFSVNRSCEQLQDLERQHKIEKAELIKVNETQYKKLIADSLTKREMRRLIDSLEIEAVKDAKIVLVPTIQLKDQEKIVDTIHLPSESRPLYIADYYPDKVKPFVKYTLNDSTGKFSFYPVDIALVVSENKDGTWQVDTKMPEYFNVTNITAVGRPQPIAKKQSPFYVGGGIQKQNDRYPISVLGGFRVNRTIIFGGVNTEGQVELKTLYNL